MYQILNDTCLLSFFAANGGSSSSDSTLKELNLFLTFYCILLCILTDRDRFAKSSFTDWKSSCSFSSECFIKRQYAFSLAYLCKILSLCRYYFSACSSNRFLWPKLLNRLLFPDYSSKSVFKRYAIKSYVDFRLCLLFGYYFITGNFTSSTYCSLGSNTVDYERFLVSLVEWTKFLRFCN